MSSWANIAANTGSSSKHHTSNAAPFKIRRETSSAKKNNSTEEEVAVETLASIPKIDRVRTYFSKCSHSLKSSILSIFNLHICRYRVALYL